MKCWELFGCEEKDCPAYRSGDPKCWLIPRTRCRNEIQGKFLDKIQMCIECEAFKANIGVDSVAATLRVVSEQLTEFGKMVEARDRELESISMELALGLSEVCDALKRISSGDPNVRIPETSKLELITKVKQIVNLTANSIGDLVDLSHEFAIGLAEHFDALHRVSTGDLGARIAGTSKIELLESLKKVTNQMIDSVSREIDERKRAEEALLQARDDLEFRVEERTAELTRSNALLKREIAERERAEKECRNVNEELNSFVHVVSHDLKNPITCIQGFSSRLAKKFDDKLDADARRYVEQIQAGARRMETLVSDLLELSRIGSLTCSFQNVPSLQIVRSVVASLENRLQEKGIELVLSGNFPTICCDEERMHQVFENLLVNAIKFMGPRQNPKIEVGCMETGDFYQFYVKDNGIGIDPKHHQKIFEMFCRLNEIRDGEGTGLGLAIVERIVNSFGGSIWVESEKGEGATFHFTVPKRPST